MVFIACFVLIFVFMEEIEGWFVFKIYSCGYSLGFVAFPTKGVRVHNPGLWFLLSKVMVHWLSVFWVWVWVKLVFLREG